MKIAEIVGGTHAVLLECSEEVQATLADHLRPYRPLSLTVLDDRDALGETLESLGRPATVILELSDRLDDRLDLARWIEESRDDRTMVLLVVPEEGRSEDDHGGSPPPDRLSTRPRRRLVTARSWRWPDLSRLLAPPAVFA